VLIGKKGSMTTKLAADECWRQNLSIRGLALLDLMERWRSRAASTN
jgi:hypothetical protein